MNPSELAQMIHDMDEERLEVFINKSADYANEDALANFKRMHILCAAMNINTTESPTDCALFLVMLKLDRWQNLRNKQAKPKNEAVKDTILDLHNYIDLAYACELEGVKGWRHHISHFE